MHPKSLSQIDHVLVCMHIILGLSQLPTTTSPQAKSTVAFPASGSSSMKIHPSISKEGSTGNGPRYHFPGFGWNVQDHSYFGKHGGGGYVMGCLVLGGAPRNSLA